jgi:hypothetical protein
VDWTTLPIEDVPLERLVWPCHDIDPAHVHPDPGVSLSAGPIHVQLLVDGSAFVHDGRHRSARAALAGHTHIAARVLR